jgi:hypothetical protein
LRRRYVVGQGASDLKPIARPNRRLINPGTGTEVFGTFPALISKYKDFDQGPIYLKEGSHSGPNKGHGIKHICAEHFNEITDSAAAEAAAIALVQSILVPGSEILHEVQGSDRDDRATIVRRPEGVVIVQEAADGTGATIYLVITAIPDANGRGTVIGTL